VISLALRCSGPSVEGFAVEQHPRYSVSRRFRVTGIMATNSLGQILAGTDVAPFGLLAPQHIKVKHSALSEVHVGARGFEPPTSWSQTTRSTKLSYAPKSKIITTICSIAHLACWPVCRSLCENLAGSPAGDCRFLTANPTRGGLAAFAPRGYAQQLLVPQIGCEAFFDCRERFASSRCVIGRLIAPDLTDTEIFCLRMRKIKPADTRTGVHRE
jgi:hypothetical protein